MSMYGDFFCEASLDSGSSPAGYTHTALYRCCHVMGDEFDENVKKDG